MFPSKKFSDVNSIVYKVQIDKLSDDDSKFDVIKKILLHKKGCGSVFTGLRKNKIKKEQFHDESKNHHVYEHKEQQSTLIAESAYSKNNTMMMSIYKTMASDPTMKNKYSSLVSGLSMISKGVASINSKIDLTYYIRDPLVIVMCIGDYDKDVMPSLIGASQDYLNCIYTFHSILGYSLVYKNKITKELEYLKKDRTAKNIDQEFDEPKQQQAKKNKFSLNACKKNVKTRWAEDEIANFFDNVKEKVLTNKHDACIFIISAHGEAEGVILDSEGEEVSLGLLFASFNGAYCQYLVDKPKIVIVDACRGQMKAKLVTTLKLNTDENTMRDIVSMTAINHKSIDSNENHNTDKTKTGMFQKDGKAACSALINVKDVNDKIRQITKNMIRINDKYYHEGANFRYIYNNLDGFAVPDGGSKGGYLIRGVKRVFLNFEISLKKNLDEIVNKIRTEVSEMIGKGSQAIVEDVNTMTYKIMFEKKDKS